MESPVHSMSNLFAQLGRPNDEAAIAQFIDSHRPLAEGVRRHEAPFWTESQAGFLRESVLADADWANVVDALNGDLHARH